MIQSGGSYHDDENFSLDSETLAERMAGIKTALLKMKNSPPPIQIGIFSDTQLHPSDLMDAKRELFDYQQKQQNIKETWTESWMKSKFPIYSRIISIIIKLIICCLQCGGNLLWTVLYQWMADNLDMMADFFLGLLGSVQAHSRYTSLFGNVPIFGPIFRILFSFFKFIFGEVGDKVSSGVIPMIIRMLYNLILTLRPYFNTVYRYVVILRQVQSGNPTIYLTLFMSTISMFFEKNISQIPGLSLLRIPLLHHNLWTVFNELLRFHQAGYDICQWCTGAKLLKLKEEEDNQNKYEIANYDSKQNIQNAKNNYKEIESPSTTLPFGFGRPTRNYLVNRNLRGDGNNYQQYLYDVNPESMGINNFRRTFNNYLPGQNIDGSPIDTEDVINKVTSSRGQTQQPQIMNLGREQRRVAAESQAIKDKNSGNPNWWDEKEKELEKTIRETKESVIQNRESALENARGFKDVTKKVLSGASDITGEALEGVKGVGSVFIPDSVRRLSNRFVSGVTDTGKNILSGVGDTDNYGKNIGTGIRGTEKFLTDTTNKGINILQEQAKGAREGLMGPTTPIDTPWGSSFYNKIFGINPEPPPTTFTGNLVKGAEKVISGIRDPDNYGSNLGKIARGTQNFFKKRTQNIGTGASTQYENFMRSYTDTHPRRYLRGSGGSTKKKGRHRKENLSNSRSLKKKKGRAFTKIKSKNRSSRKRKTKVSTH